jgi:hypothetical protein
MTVPSLLRAWPSTWQGHNCKVKPTTLGTAEPLGMRNTENDWISSRRIPSGRTIVHATVAHVHAVDDGITKRRAALNDSPVSIDATRRQFTERWTAAAWTAPAEITRRCYH